MKRKIWLILAIIAALTIGAAIWLEPTREDLFELCRTEGGPKIYRTVVAGGYYDGTNDTCWNCWAHLANTSYQFIEFQLSRQRHDFQPLNQPGFYRVTRIDADSKSCDRTLTDFYKKYNRPRELMERNHWCFQVDKLSAPEARYGRYSEGLGRIRRNPLTGTTISVNHGYLRDRENGEIIAEYRDFIMSSMRYFRFSSFGTPLHCNSFINELGSAGFDKREVILAP